jgi:hypothetical protein
MITQYKRLLFVIVLVTGLVIFFSTCVQGPVQRGDGRDVRGEAFAGAAACVSCHRGIHDSALHSSHALSLRPASREAIRGSFTPPDNTFQYDGDRKVVMEVRDSGLFQVAFTGGHEQQAHRFDMVMGSGRKGQTYLYWKGEGVSQLPVSYFLVAGGWANSPRYPMDTVWFGRMVSFECFACHTSYIRMKKSVQVSTFHQMDQYDRTRIVYGIDCERCHGPAAAHVKYQEEHPEDKQAKYIAVWNTLSRQQRTDVCGVCHSGAHGFTRAVFGFRPGDTLTNYFYPESGLPAQTGTMDVHGNQYGLLVASKCFLQSRTMECATCHDVHRKERKSLAAYSITCMGCHQAGQVGKVHVGMEPLGVLVKNCIDCHMPVGESKMITIQRNAGTDIMAHLARRHLIGVYPNATPSSDSSGSPIRSAPGRARP